MKSNDEATDEWLAEVNRRLDDLESRVMGTEIRHDQADAWRRSFELDQQPLPSQFNGIDPFTVPLPDDGPQAIGQLVKMVIWTHAENGKLRKELSDIKKSQGFADYQKRMADLLDKPQITKRLDDLEAYRAQQETEKLQRQRGY